MSWWFESQNIQESYLSEGGTRNNKSTKILGVACFSKSSHIEPVLMTGTRRIVVRGPWCSSQLTAARASNSDHPRVRENKKHSTDGTHEQSVLNEQKFGHHFGS